MRNSSIFSSSIFEKSIIENILGIHFTDNNKVKLLESGRETFQKILDSVSSAREIICIEFYIFKDDDTGKKLADLLKVKAKQGVRVYLLYDHFGSFLTSRGFWSDLKKAGVNIRVSHPFKWSAPRGYIYRNHKKLLVIDGKKAFTGGFNIADEYHGYFKKRKTLWRDTGIYLEGPIASTLLNIFRKSWATWKGESINCDVEHEALNHGVPVIPIFANSGRARRKMRKLLIYSIKNAKESIFLTTAYFIPGKRILRALIHAARRGVTLRLLLPGKSDVMPVLYAGRSYYTRLLKAGIEIYNYQGAVLHAKTTVFDGCWSIIGSANLDFQSLRRNEESNVGILDRDFSRQMVELFQRDIRNSLRIDTGAWVKRPFYQKVLEKFFYLIIKKL
ncbi:MAG TPA: cardiolipin synthase B [Nitrospirae bacterium]|nr:putative cardiolipin synthase YwiE [bacterium BMS3Abin06]HDH13253.1 cardiolipin synthase B [Nitrospirota bacterium]HDZ01779.1 cardiolipin synthase B [Nitrospirota bacterium]